MSQANNEVSQLRSALQAMWRFASTLVDKHGMNGTDTLSDSEHLAWQEASGSANAVLGTTNQPLFDAWHLFYIEATGGDDATGDKVRTFLVSADSGCERKAEEMARYAVDDFLPAGWTVTRSEYICYCGTDIFKEVTQA